MKRLLYLICIVVLCLTSCRTAKQNVAPTVVTLNDSVRETATYVETLRLDTVFVEISVPAQSAAIVTYEGASHLSTDFAESDAWINPDGSLGHTLRNIEQTFKPPAVVPVKDSETITSNEHIKEVPVPYPEPYPVEKKLTWGQSFKINSFWYLVIGCVLLGLICFRKPLFAMLRKYFS